MENPPTSETNGEDKNDLGSSIHEVVIKDYLDAGAQFKDGNSADNIPKRDVVKEALKEDENIRVRAEIDIKKRDQKHQHKIAVGSFTAILSIWITCFVVRIIYTTDDNMVRFTEETMASISTALLAFFAGRSGRPEG